MAVLSRIKCELCGAVAEVNHRPHDSPPRWCGPCMAKRERQQRDDTLRSWAEQPLEERLRRIEAWIYDYKPPVPLSELRF